MATKVGVKKIVTRCRQMQPRASPDEQTHPNDLDDGSEEKKFAEFVAQIVRNILSDPQNIILLEEYSRGHGGFEPTVVKQGGANGAHQRNVANYEVIRPRDLPVVTGLSRTQCWRLSRDPTSGFPPKIRLSSGAVGYSRGHLEMWLKSREENKS